MRRRVVYGLNPVRELLESRGAAVNVVYVALGDGHKDLRALCANRRITLEERPVEEIEALAGSDARHQGVVAIAGELVYAELEDVLESIESPGLLVVLDGVQDPHNLGAIVRSAYVLGAHAVVIPKDRAAPITPAAVKASAGATEHIPIVRVTNVVRALEAIKEAGLWTAAAVSRDAPAPEDVDLSGPMALVVGGEAKGVRPLVERRCDLRVMIPMTGRIGSLNVSVAAGVLMYEVARQRAART